MIIKTSRQLKDKISNLSNNNSKKAQTLIRKYMMERFLARIANSKYKNNFILKGGMLVSAIVGVEARSTMDIDTTVRMMPLTKEKSIETINEIISIDLQDNICYEIKNTEEIMEEHDYSGIRFTLTATLENLRDTIKIDISTGDEITPSAIEFSYPMMFENEYLAIWSYNIETILAEKLETIIARSTLNTRMRDFYDIHILWHEKSNIINIETLYNAIINVARQRGTLELFDHTDEILHDIANSQYLEKNWNNYKNGSYYVGDLEWSDVIETAVNILQNEKIIQIRL